MLRECIYGECAHKQHVRRTLTLTPTHTITAYSVSGNVVRVRILICATRQKPCRKIRVYRNAVVCMCIAVLNRKQLPDSTDSTVVTEQNATL